MQVKKAALLLFILFLSRFNCALAFDHSDWDALLKQYVKTGLVDYQAWKGNPGRLDAYLERIKSYSLNEFSKDSREDRMALWINAYNASVIRKILSVYPVKSIRNIPDFWTDKFVVVAAMNYSLQEIREQVFRKGFRDERAILVLNSGYRSAGPLRAEAYRGSELIEQLKDQTHLFLADERYNKIKKGTKKIKISPLFKELGNDFILGYGQAEKDDQFKPGEIAILGFIRTHAQDSELVAWLDQRKYKIRYLKDDWGLNESRENKN